MARHRVGNSYLSDQEYAINQSENWKIGLFLIVGIIAGLIVYNLTKTIEIKALRFSLVISSGILFGYLAARFREIIRTALSIFIMLGVLYGIGLLIWNNM